MVTLSESFTELTFINVIPLSFKNIIFLKQKELLMIAEDTPSDTDVQSESANIHGMPVDPDTPLVKTKRETQQQVLKRLHTVSSAMLVQ